MYGSYFAGKLGYIRQVENASTEDYDACNLKYK